MLFILRFFFDLVIFIYIMSICVFETSAWCLMEAVYGQTGITVSCIQHVIQDNLKNKIIIMMTTMYNFFSVPKCD